MRLFQLALVLGSLTLGATAASAVTHSVDGFDSGFASFASTVAGFGGTEIDSVLAAGATGSPLDLGDFSIARNDGSGVIVGSAYSLLDASPARTTTGGVIDISVEGSTPESAKASGVTFTFAKGINALGFEVGDWGTCCFASDLYMQFDDGAAILVGHAAVEGDQYLTNGGAGVFVSAFDATKSFTSVKFWGDGFGEFLVVGGTVRYATLADGGVPEPATWAMFVAGFGLVGARLRGRRPAAAA